MAFVLLDNAGVVIQKQPYPQTGFIEVADNVICGQIHQPDGSFTNPPASPPPATPGIDHVIMRDQVTGADVIFEARNGQLYRQGS